MAIRYLILTLLLFALNGCGDTVNGKGVAEPKVKHFHELLQRGEFAAMYEEWNMYMSDERPTGVPADELAVHVCLHGADLDRKLAALRAMATQTSALIAMIGHDVYAKQVCEESFVEARIAR